MESLTADTKLEKRNSHQSIPDRTYHYRKEWIVVTDEKGGGEILFCDGRGNRSRTGMGTLQSQGNNIGKEQKNNPVDGAESATPYQE